MDHLRGLSPNANIVNGFGQGGEKTQQVYQEVIECLTTKALQLPNLSPKKLKTRVTLSYPTHKVFVKASKRSVVDMAFKCTSKVQDHQEHPGLPQGQRPYGQPKWCHLLVQCGDPGCDDEYIGETFMTFGERYKEHLKAPSAIHHHSSQIGHPTSHNNFQIIGRGDNLARNIKESICIRVNNPALNNDIGKFNLPHIWDRVLL